MTQEQIEKEIFSFVRKQHQDLATFINDLHPKGGPAQAVDIIAKIGATHFSGLLIHLKHFVHEGIYTHEIINSILNDLREIFPVKGH